MAEIVALYALALAFGGMVFFAGLFSPLVFTRLPAEVAGPFIRGVFPWYFLGVAVLLGAGGAALLAVAPAWGAALLILAGLGVVNREVLMLRINALRDRELAGEAGAAAGFARLHRLSIGINLAQMVAAGAALWLFT